MTTTTELVQQYLAFAATEVKREGGKPRSASTMSSYRRALESFAEVVTKSGLDLTKLPTNFIEESWLPTQEAIAKQPVQLRIRATAIKKFTQWCYANNIPCAPLRHLDLPTPTKQFMPPQESTMSNAVLTDVSQLGDASREVDPVPTVASYQPVIPPSVPPPAPQRAPAPQQASKQAPRTNPLSNMLPVGQFKLRVWREREGGEDPVFVNDYLSDRVRMAGAIEPFIARECGPVVQKQGIYGDVSFIVCAVGPGGAEGEKTRYTITVPPLQPLVSTPASVQAAQPAGTREELVDLLSTQRRVTEELEDRLAARIENKQAQQQQQTNDRAPSNDMDDLKQIVRSLATRVNDLADRMESRDSQRYVEPMPAATPAAQPTTDVVRIIEALKVAQPQPQSQSMGMVEMLKVLGEARAMFQPQNIQVDTSPLEDDLREMRRELAESKKGGIGHLVNEFKGLKELFSLVGGEPSAPKPTVMGLLGDAFLKFIENPAPLAEAAERVFLAARGTAATPMTAPTSAKFPTQVTEALKRMLSVEDPDALVVAAHEWMTAMNTVPALQKPVVRISALLREGKLNELAIYLKTVFQHLGVEVPPEACVELSKTLIARTRKPEPQLEATKEPAEDEEEEEGGEGEEEQPRGPVDMNIRVGGASHEDDEEESEEAESEDTSDEGEEGEVAEEPDHEGADGENVDEDGSEEAEAEGAEEAPRTADNEDDEPSPEEIAQAAVEVTETKSERRKRRKAEKEVATAPVPIEKFTKPSART